MSTFTSEQISKAIATACEAIGVAQLKAKQEDAIRGFIRGHDVFVCLPTGYGKSLCFALLPLVYDVLYRRKGSIVVCVSPLTSLMMEQAAKFKIQGILSEFVGELQQDVDAMIQVKNGMIQLLYISPESLLRNQQWREMLLSRVYQDNLVAVVVHSKNAT